MQKTFKNQQGREFLLLDLPSDVDKVFIDVSDYYYRSTIGDSFSEPNKFYISLPQGNYQIICLAKDATEEQAKQIVREVYTPNDVANCYENYNGDFFFETAKESLTSLLTSLGFKQDDNVLILEKI